MDDIASIMNEMDVDDAKTIFTRLVNVGPTYIICGMKIFARMKKHTAAQLLTSMTPTPLLQDQLFDQTHGLSLSNAEKAWICAEMDCHTVANIWERGHTASQISPLALSEVCRAMKNDDKSCAVVNILCNLQKNGISSGINNNNMVDTAAKIVSNMESKTAAEIFSRINTSGQLKYPDTKEAVAKVFFRTWSILYPSSVTALASTTSAMENAGKHVAEIIEGIYSFMNDDKQQIAADLLAAVHEEFENQAIRITNTTKAGAWLVIHERTAYRVGGMNTGDPRELIVKNIPKETMRNLLMKMRGDIGAKIFSNLSQQDQEDIAARLPRDVKTNLTAEVQALLANQVQPLISTALTQNDVEWGIP